MAENRAKFGSVLYLVSLVPGLILHVLLLSLIVGNGLFPEFAPSNAFEITRNALVIVLEPVAAFALSGYLWRWWSGEDQHVSLTGGAVACFLMILYQLWQPKPSGIAVYPGLMTGILLGIRIRASWERVDSERRALLLKRAERSQP